MMARPRKQTYTLEMYLKKNRKGDIDNNADVQRNFAWNNEQINELIVTVLTDDYIPPIILGEEENSKLHIVDGGCRTVALIKFRYMNYKITSSIDHSLISYKKKIASEDGLMEYEDAVFDIKNKTYAKLPEELREKFDEYQIETVIHEFCDSRQISKYIKRYNNHVAMNTDQKAFTYLDKYASKVRKILDSRFFVECNSYTEKDKAKGVVERIVIESMMCMNHFDNWKTQVKAACRYLNEVAASEEFDAFANVLCRLEKIITEDIKEIFNKKDSFIFITLFDRFTKIGMEDARFAEFLREFHKNLRNAKRNANGLLFDEIDNGLCTKDRQVIADKLSMLEELMHAFLQITVSDGGLVETFLAENLGMDVQAVREDLDLYIDSLDSLMEDAVKIDSKLRHEQNRVSLLAMMAYSYQNDQDLDDWMRQYAMENNTYIPDQKENYLHMRADFERYLIQNA